MDLTKYITPEQWPNTEKEVLSEFLKIYDDDLQYAYEMIYQHLQVHSKVNSLKFNIDEVFEEIIEANYSFFIEELVKRQIKNEKNN